MNLRLYIIALSFTFGFAQDNDSIPSSPINNSSEATSPFKIPAILDSIWQHEYLDLRLNDGVIPHPPTLDRKATLHTDTLKHRLALLNAKTPINIEYSPILEQTIASYLKTRRGTFEHLMGLSHFYFPLFEEIFDNVGVPLEIKYLAIVESMLKPNAKSPVGATGLWQFMFSTAKHYNLEVSSYVDERCDPERATLAAAQYLKRLYSIFGDWTLAMAAYNSGPGNVTKAMRRSGGYTNYWNIRPFLPKETAGYIPKFLATLYIFEYAKEHGLHSPMTPLHFQRTDTLSVQHMISLDHVEKVLGIDKSTLTFLNPSYKFKIIPVIKNRSYNLRLPIEFIGPFVAKEAQIYAYASEEFSQRETPLPKFFKMDSKIRYKVKPGDYLGKIANKFKVRVSEIRRWNNMTSDNLRAGDRITIFTRNLDDQTEANSSSASGLKKTYVVQEGDSLWSISQKFSGLSVDKLKLWNGISGSTLKPGMLLVISK